MRAHHLAIWTLTAIGLLLHGATGIAVAQSVSPVYDSTGRLLLPQNFESWVFVGSNLGLEYKPEAMAMTAREAQRAEESLFHNIYIDPAAYAEFVRSGTFPDPTILMMDNYIAEARDTGGVLKEGVFNGKRKRVEAAVKDSRRPTRPLSKETWAYYLFPLGGDGQPVATARAFDDAECHACHKMHAGPDNVWVQFYPQLRRWLRP